MGCEKVEITILFHDANRNYGVEKARVQGRSVKEYWDYRHFIMMI